MISLYARIFAVILFGLCCAGASEAKSYGIAVDNSKVCPAVQQSLGQLLYINVDGYGRNVGQAIHPDYIKLVKLLNIGGVLPHFGLKDPASIAQASQALFKATKQPLLLGIYSQAISLPKNQSAKQVTIGLGEGAGWMKEYQASNNRCFEQQTFLDAFLHKAMGLNQALGPTVDQNKHWGYQFGRLEDLTPVVEKTLSRYDNMGIKATLKHYPYAPQPFKLLSNPVDSLLSKKQVMAKLEIFKSLFKRTDIIQTSHLFNSNIDSKYIATHSKNWLGILTRDMGYKGLILSAAIPSKEGNEQIFKNIGKGWLTRHPTDDPQAVFAAKAIMAGHDMVMIEGVARDALRIYQQLAVMACRNDADGWQLQALMGESYKRVSAFKANNWGALSYRPKVDELLVDDVLRFKHQLDSESCANVEQSQYEFLRLKQRILAVR